MLNDEHLVALGNTEIKVFPLGLGTWQWGDRLFWEYSKTHTNSDVRAAFQVSMEAGVNFFDTAEIYGSGLSEKLLGQFVKESGQPVVIGTKFMPFPWRLWKGTFHSALRASLNRLGVEKVDLYQIHWPMPPVSIETWMQCMADAVQNGLIKAVGVSNYNASQLRRAYAALSARGIRLASNQVEYSLLDRQVEINGLLALCQELGVTLIAYSPLAKGLLTGKYTPENPPPGLRSRTYSRDLLARIQVLTRLLREIGLAHGDRTPAQVALNWLLCKGALAIPGAKNARQAQENVGAVGWRLTEAEVAALDKASEAVNP